jgi:hypothetical protein
VYQLGPRSWKPDASLADNVSNNQAESVLQEACIMTDSVITPSESNATMSDANSGEILPEAKQPNQIRSQVKPTASAGSGTRAVTSAKNVGRSSAKRRERPVAPSDGVNNPVAADDSSRFGPWSVNDNGLDVSHDELPSGLKSAMSLSMSSGVQKKRVRDE